MIYKKYGYTPHGTIGLNKKMPLKTMAVRTELHQSMIPLVLQVPPVPPRLVEPGVHVHWGYGAPTV